MSASQLHDVILKQKEQDKLHNDKFTDLEKNINDHKILLDNLQFQILSNKLESNNGIDNINTGLDNFNRIVRIEEYLLKLSTTYTILDENGDQVKFELPN